ncbi:MAG: aminotransferase class I/II-fold pyridoxal phosphate-dependent enzyme [Deltaproteobacteria bacterium]|nr:aminotransferase class I/II-fold pyridoxal phosphate-dependent enzyme [Deltaproteobacteria bacterium]
MPLFADRTELIGTENAFKIGPCIREVEATGQRVLKCNLGEPDFPLPMHIREEIKRQIDNDLTHYCDPQGIVPLREAVASHINATRGLDVSPDQVVIFPGAKPPIGLCQQTYCNPGDEVIYPSPGFPIYESFTTYIKAKPIPLHLEEELGFSFRAEDLKKLINRRTKLIFLNFPSNPTGGVASARLLGEIAEVIEACAPPNVRVYSDEVYEHILFDGHRHQSIATLLPQKTIIVSGVSKSYSWTGGRIGWAIFPTVEEASIFKNLNINYFSCIPAYNQMGAKVAIESPESVVSIRQMVTAFEERRDVVVKALGGIPGIRCQQPKGAFYVFPQIGGMCENLGAIEAMTSLPETVRRKTSPSTLVQMFLLYRYALATMDRKSFGRIGADNKHYLRISIATSMDDLRLAMERLREVAGDRQGFAQFVREGNHLW